MIAGVAIDGGNPDDLENEKQSITMIKRQGKVKALEEEIDRGKLHPPPSITMIKRQGKVKVLEEEIDRGKSHPPPLALDHHDQTSGEGEGPGGGDRQR